MYHQIEDNTHLLHGVVHANGYGHLLTLNGREGGSKLLSGSDIMGFWDRLCATISVRSVYHSTFSYFIYIKMILIIDFLSQYVL